MLDRSDSLQSQLLQTDRYSPRLSRDLAPSHTPSSVGYLFSRCSLQRKFLPQAQLDQRCSKTNGRPCLKTIIKACVHFAPSTHDSKLKKGTPRALSPS